MKLELVHTIEADGEWFKVYVDGKLEKAFSVYDNGSNRDEERERAKSFYNKIKELKTSREVLLSEEI